ncbi:porin [bacterium]|nr:porin [bacterium]
MRKAIVVLGVAVLAVLCAPAGGAEATAREKELEQRVEALEKRIETLERLLEARGAPPAATPAPAVAEKRDGTAFSGRWKDGPVWQSQDGDYTFKVGGRVQTDWAWMTEDGDVRDVVGDLSDGVEFRRAYLTLAGLMYKRIEWKAEYDFAGGDVAWRDVYMGITDVPFVGGIRAGHFKEPFGLEELPSDNFTTFMEKSLANTFAPSRNTGLAVGNAPLDQRMTWAAGVFRDTDNFGNRLGEGQYAVTGRLTGLPYYAEEGAHLVHVGAAASRRSVPDEMAQFAERPEAHLAPRFVDTGKFAADMYNLFGTEAAFLWGPFSMQGEYMLADVDAEHGDDPRLDGGYVLASWMLTGEHRNYNRRLGGFDRMRPRRNFLDGEGGLGAWELAVRWSTLDLSDELLSGGELSDVTVGLNWYLNPNSRIMWNWVHGDLDDVGDADIFQMRLQIDF